MSRWPLTKTALLSAVVVLIAAHANSSPLRITPAPSKLAKVPSAASAGNAPKSVNAPRATKACVASKSPSFALFRCEENSVWIVETRRAIVPFYYAVNPMTLRQLGIARTDMAMLMNGSYHDGDYANARLEGLFAANGKQYAALKPLDNQLSHVISITESGAVSAIQRADEAFATNARIDTGTHIQTGPLLTQNGLLTKEFIDAAINGKDRYKRTAVGVTADGTIVFVIAKTPRSLLDLANVVLDKNDYRVRKLTLVNLDGGPSTAIYSTEQPSLSYQPDKVTPIVLGITR
jgi:uncharacterized protein YigE (DUF2233 family)